MPRYEVRHAYRSARDGRQFGPWVAGDVVELDAADAEWLLRDSPGCLLRAGGAVERPANEPARAKPALADRQHRGGRNRSGS